MIKNFKKGVNEGAIEDKETKGALLYWSYNEHVTRREIALMRKKMQNKK